MASIFTKVLDRVTPWNRGGEVQRRLEKKKKDEEEAKRRAMNFAGSKTYNRNTPDQEQSQPLDPQKPVNIFEDLNKDLTLGRQPDPVVSVQNQPLPIAEPPQPGTVIKPKQNLFERARDQFDANTQADQYRRAEGNRLKGENKDIVLRDPGNIVSKTPVVGTATKMINTAGVQDRQIKATARMLIAQATGNTEAYRKAAEDARSAEENFKKNKGGLFNVGTLYDSEAARRGDIKTGVTDITLPSVVAAADVYTLGKGSAISEGFKQGGKAAFRTQAPNIVKAGVGNYASGDLDARSQGATNEQAVKAGLINSVLGLAPDILLPMIGKSLKNRVIPSLFKGRGVNPTDIVEEVDDAAISASAEAAIQATKPRPIPVQQNIPVSDLGGDSLDIPVQIKTPEKPIIREVAGDAKVATPNAQIAQNVVDVRRATAAENVPSARPDTRIEGVTPRAPERPFALDENTVATGQAKVVDDYATLLREVGEGNGVDILPDGRRASNNYRPADTKGKKMSKTAWREEAERQLANGEADTAFQKAFNESADPEVQALLAKGERPDVPEGQPIVVKTVNGIDVVDNTNVPQNLPEVPGTVRVTEQTSPMAAKTEAVANTPTVSTPVALPKEVQEVLDNPKQFNKRQVAAARNQRKLARQMAKTQEDTAAAMSRIEASKTNPGAGQPEGFAPTGEFRVGKRGNVSESASAVTEAQAGTREMADRSVDDLLDEIAGKETLSAGDRRRISAAKENLKNADPENFRATDKYKLLDRLEKAGRSDLGRGLALIPRTIRKTANGDALAARWERKIANVLDDPSKMTDGQWKQVQGANDAFTSARDRAGALEEQFRKTGSEADFKAWEQAHKAARDADTAAKMTEVKVAQQILKGEKGANVTKTIDALKKEADVNTMDFVTANMLSGTGTGFRNLFGTELAGVENRVGANLRAKITKGIFNEDVGGFDRQGARFGRKYGGGKWLGDMKRRASNGGKNPIEWSKNWATTINSAGESSMQSQVYSRLAKYYKNQFDGEGLTGKQLDLRMRHAMITDPDEMADIYLDATMKSSGLTGMFEKGQTIEKGVADLISRQVDSKYVQGASKLIMRILVGFPTATGNFLYQSAKRLTLGTPSYIESGLKAAQGDKVAAAQAFERGLKETGSGAAVYGLGAALGSAGLISGPYPSDPDERERWTRDGISENSIKIGGAWYPIPQGAGMFGLPLMTGAAVARDGTDGLKEMYSPKNLSKLLPTDQIQGTLNMLSGDGGPQDLKNTVASSVRALTPVGALLNQVSKSFDDTKNDTSTKDFWSNVFDQVYSGIPGVNNAMDIPDKTDAEGNVIRNPNAAQLAFGATSAVQDGGEQRSREINEETNSVLKQIDQYGLLDDANMEGVLKDSGLDAFNKAKSGKQLDESDIKALKEGLVKGVSSEGTDTAYLERGQYDTNLAVLKLKRDLMKEDTTVKPSSLKDIDTAIKRGEIYKEGEIPYDLISDYQGTGVEEWRKMGDPEADEYDPDMYQRLWDIDERMTKAGVSYKKGALDKHKYTAKNSGKGGGKGGKAGSKIDTDFGTLKDARSAPKVQQYDSIDGKAGSVPIIRRVRPNIVHKITSSG